MKSTRLKIGLHSFAFFFLALILSSCKKEDTCDHPSLPCQTHEGKNTFGCLVDGVPFVAKTSFSIGGTVAVSGQFDETVNLLQLTGSREDANEHIESIKFKVYVTQGVSSYAMSVNTSSYQGYTYSNNPDVCIYYHDLNNKGTLGISYLDIEKNIIAGTFSMTLINPDCTKSSLVITEGRFDFGY